MSEGAWVQSNGKVWNEDNQAWEDAWGGGDLIVTPSMFYCVPNGTVWDSTYNIVVNQTVTRTATTITGTTRSGYSYNIIEFITDFAINFSKYRTLSVTFDTKLYTKWDGYIMICTSNDSTSGSTQLITIGQTKAYLFSSRSNMGHNTNSTNNNLTYLFDLRSLSTSGHLGFYLNSTASGTTVTLSNILLTV